MVVLHVLDSSLPILSGYSIRTHHIIMHQQQYCASIGITSPYYVNTNKVETIDSVKYYRSFRSRFSDMVFQKNIPLIKHYSIEKDFERDICSLIREVNPNIIHGHSSHHIAYPAYRMAKRYNIPFVYEIRGLWEETLLVQGIYKKNSIRYKYNKSRETFLAKKARKVFVISESLKEDLVYRGIHREKLVVIPNGIVGNDSKPAAEEEKKLHAKYNLEGSIVIGYIGSINGYESLDLLIKLIAHFVGKSKKVKGLIVGQGPEKENLIKLSDLLGIRDKIIFTGAINPDIIHAYYSLIDIFIITRYKGRAVQLVTPLKPYEAMEAGKCLVMSDLPALREIVQNKTTGLLYQPGDENDLISKCECLIDDDCLREKMGQAARKWVLKNRQWSDIVKNYFEHYKQLVDPN
jgi:glycosyltransferase involved in cell wall biosynthesis